MQTTSRIQNEKVNEFTATVLLPSINKFRCTLEHNSFDELEQTTSHILETSDDSDYKLIFKMVKMISQFAKECGATKVKMYPVISRTMHRTHLMLRFSFPNEYRMKLFKRELVEMSE